ncbi:MAG TPA: hypothetical protein PKD90_07255, partial [Phnomibacter sp.]|nr:hypothetical protein [Phnomibacter sp.]
MSIHNTLLEKLLLPLGDAFLGTSYIKKVKWVRSLVQMNDAELNAWKQQQLKAYLHHTLLHSNYYKNLPIATAEAPTDPL